MPTVSAMDNGNQDLDLSATLRQRGACLRCRANGSVMDERNLGPQPLAAAMERLGLSPHDLVAASPSPITHKMVARAAKGRRVTRHTAELVLAALNAAANSSYGLGDIFGYEP